MLRYSELPIEQLASLTEEQIQLLIDLEIAHEGILPVECPQKPTLSSVNIQQDDQAYEVAGILVKKQEDALTIANLSVLEQKYDYSGAGYSYKWVEPHIDMSIKPVSFYKKEDVMRVRTALTDMNKFKEKYAAEEKAYENFVKRTSNTRNEVWACVMKAGKKVQEIKSAEVMYKKYLVLADNEEWIAKKFFLDAYRTRPDIVKAVLDIDIKLPEVKEE